MRIALISDLHGNEVALEAVLRDAEGAGVEKVLCLGDVASLGPRPREVVDRLRDLGVESVLGNHDEFLLVPELIHDYTEAPVIHESVAWCREQLDAEQLGFLRSFQRSMEIDAGDGATLLLVHGTPRSNMEELLATTPVGEVDAMLEGVTATVVAGGHTHLQMLRQHRGRLLVNPGSVGMPFETHAAGREPTVLSHAEYAMVEVVAARTSVDLRRISIDGRALRESVVASSFPLRDTLLRQYP